MIRLALRSESCRKRLYRRDNLERLANRIAEGESLPGDAEVSVLFVDDAQMKAINKAYRNMPKTTDVLSFEQEGPAAGGVRILGDIVISLETVESRYPGDASGMRDEVRLLFCHGLLHLLGYDHDTRAAREAMTRLQARYLGRAVQAAWFAKPEGRAAVPAPKGRPGGGGSTSVGQR
ncbi:MAG: rRNA maturation RNase YbeY [Candidatus Hydrogenedens sp.]|nr:rRNA maturation RNase YbeY [Candidatus Hydrogenedens sp.]